MKAESEKAAGTAVLPAATSVGSMEDLSVSLTRAETIRIRAYEIFLNRGGFDGADVDDWIQAEKECFGS
jgi:hypothetical protein